MQKMQNTLFAKAWAIIALVLIGIAVAMANPSISFASFEVETPSCTPYGWDWFQGKCTCSKTGWAGICTQAVYKPVTAVPAPVPQTVPTPATMPSLPVPTQGQTYNNGTGAGTGAPVQPAAPAAGNGNAVYGASCSNVAPGTKSGDLVCSSWCGGVWTTMGSCPSNSAPAAPPTNSVPTGPALSPTAAPKTPQPVTYSINGGTVVLFGVDPYAKFQIGAAVAAVPDPLISDAVGALIVGVAVYELYLAGETGILLNDLAVSLPPAAIPSVPTAQALTGGGNMPPKCIDAWFMLSQNQAFEKIPNGVKLLSDWQHFSVTTPNGASVKWGNLINTLLSPECGPYFNVETVKNLGDEFFKITMK